MSRIGESATMRVTRLADELRAQGVKIISFGAGEPDFESPRVAVEAAQQALDRGLTKYTPLAGTVDLRAALADCYQERWQAPWSASQVLVTVGGKAALFQLALALFEAGREVIIPAPCWVSFPEQVRFAGARPVLVPTDPETGFKIQAEPLIEAITASTGAMILNHPCNPTGSFLEPSALRQVVEAAAERGLVVIVDETYERFYFDGRRHLSAATLAAEFPDTVVLVGSFSKTFAMTGWRVGYALGPAWLIEAAAAIQSHSTSNATSFAMPGAVAALRGAEAEVERMVREYEARRDLLLAGVQTLPGFECRPPPATFYAFPRVASCYTPKCDGSAAFAEYLLREAGVAVVPGAAFGEDDHIRLSFACSRANLEEGLTRLRDLLGS